MKSVQLPILKRRRAAPKASSVQGLPPLRYHLPVVVTLLTTLLIVVVVVFLTLISWANALTSLNGMGSQDEGAGATGLFLCGAFGLVGIAASLYFAWAAVKGVRDLMEPPRFTRGTLVDKREIGGRVVGSWVGLAASYAGPDRERAALVSDEQAAASVDRKKIVQPRGAAPVLPAPPKTVRQGYLSPDRISSKVVRDSNAPAGGRRTVFRVEPAPFEAIGPGEEVLVAHSRFLEHIYYVAHLRDGEWETFPAKQLI